MKKLIGFIGFIGNTVKKTAGAVSGIIRQTAGAVRRSLDMLIRRIALVKALVASNAAEGYIDTAVKIIIGVVIGGVILAGLYALFNTTIIPTLTNKITQMFSYSGA